MRRVLLAALVMMLVTLGPDCTVAPVPAVVPSPVATQLS